MESVMIYMTKSKCNMMNIDYSGGYGILQMVNLRNDGTGSSYGEYQHITTTNDIIGVALDMDKQKLFFIKTELLKWSGRSNIRF